MAVLLLTPWALGTQTLQAHLSCFHDFCSIFSLCVFFLQEITGYSGKLEGGQQDRDVLFLVVDLPRATSIRLLVRICACLLIKPITLEPKKSTC